MHTETIETQTRRDEAVEVLVEGLLRLLAGGRVPARPARTPVRVTRETDAADRPRPATR